MADILMISRSAYQALKAGAISGNAGHLLGFLKANAEAGLPRQVLPGDAFGRIMAWMWSQDRDETVLLLADYLAELREHHVLAADVTPPVSLDEVLDGLQLAWPGTADETDFAELVDYARGRVAGYYSKAV